MCFVRLQTKMHDPCDTYMPLLTAMRDGTRICAKSKRECMISVQLCAEPNDYAHLPRNCAWTRAVVFHFVNARSCTIMYEHVRKCTIRYEHVRKCTIRYEHVRKSTKMYEHIQTCTKMYGHVRIYTDMYENIRTYTKTYDHVRTCSIM